MCAYVTNASALPHDLHIFIFQCRTPAEEPRHDHLSKHLHSFRARRAFSPMFRALPLKQMQLLVYRVQKLWSQKGNQFNKNKCFVLTRWLNLCTAELLLTNTSNCEQLNNKATCTNWMSDGLTYAKKKKSARVDNSIRETACAHDRPTSLPDPWACLHA